MYPDLLRERPLLFWGAIFAVFGFALVLMPDEVSEHWRDPLDHRQMGPFSKRVERIDFALRAGDAVALPGPVYRRMRALLQARRMSTKGGMSQSEVHRAVDLLRRRNRQVGRERSRGSRRAMRETWNRRLAETFPKIDLGDVRSALERLDRQTDRLLTLRKPDTDARSTTAAPSSESRSDPRRSGDESPTGRSARSPARGGAPGRTVE